MFAPSPAPGPEQVSDTMHEVGRCATTPRQPVPPLASLAGSYEPCQSKILGLSVAYVRTLYDPEVTVFVPGREGVRVAMGKVVGVQFVQGRLNHYRVMLADGGLLLAPPSWFRGTINLLPKHQT